MSRGRRTHSRQDQGSFAPRTFRRTWLRDGRRTWNAPRYNRDLRCGFQIWDLARGRQIIIDDPGGHMIDVLAHYLIDDEHGDRDCRHDHRVLGHRLTLGEFPMKLTRPYVYLG